MNADWIMGIAQAKAEQHKSSGPFYLALACVPLPGFLSALNWHVMTRLDLPRESNA